MSFLEALQLPPFRQRFPWLGPDLQTLRDTLRLSTDFPEQGQPVEFLLNGGDRLLGFLERPSQGTPLGLVVVLHGLGAGSHAPGPRRLARALLRQGFAALRLNLRGAGPGRHLARGTYAADCSKDLLPVLSQCRQHAAGLVSPGRQIPLAAVGISLGGTVLINTLLLCRSAPTPLLDGLVCISSPLDLMGCANQIERPRNRFYQRWLVKRLIEQTLADPQGLSERERLGLTGPDRPRTIRAFDDLITAPRWGFSDVADYYKACSPMAWLRQRLDREVGRDGGMAALPPVLLLHAMDDPWVPVGPALALAGEISRLRQQQGTFAVDLPDVLITEHGGHNGFHGQGDCADGCWSDQVASQWMASCTRSRGIGCEFPHLP